MKSRLRRIPAIEIVCDGLSIVEQNGEDVVARLFEEPQADWYIKAARVSKGGGLISSFLPTKDLYILLTAGICFPRRFLKRLNWSTSDYARLKEMNPQRAILKWLFHGFRPSFSRRLQHRQHTARAEILPLKASSTNCHLPYLNFLIRQISLHEKRD